MPPFPPSCSRAQSILWTGGQELRSGALPPGHVTRINENPLTGSAVWVLFSAQFFLRTLKSSSQNGELRFPSPRTVTTERSKRGVSTLHPSGPTGPEINPIITNPLSRHTEKADKQGLDPLPSSNLFNGGGAYGLGWNKKNLASLYDTKNRGGAEEEMHPTQEGRPHMEREKGLWGTPG